MTSILISENLQSHVIKTDAVIISQLVVIWHDGLSGESVEGMANANLHIMHFLVLFLEDDIPDHSVLSRFRTRLTTAQVWDGLLEQINQQTHTRKVTLTTVCHIDASITHSPHKPKTKPSYEVINDRDTLDDEPEAREAMRVIEVDQPGVDTEAVGSRKAANRVFGYKQHTLVDDNGLVMAAKTTAANQHDSKPMLSLLDKAVKNKPLTRRQRQRSRLITKVRFVVERSFGSQALWFGSKILRYRGVDKAHAWHILQAMAYNLRRLPKLFVQSVVTQDKYAL